MTDEEKTAQAAHVASTYGIETDQIYIDNELTTPISVCNPNHWTRGWHVPPCFVPPHRGCR